MVGKLIKYDFRSFFRYLFPIQVIIIGIAGLNRIIQIFEKDGRIYNAVFVSSIVLLCVACVVALVMSYVVAIVRFYQGLYSKEGYLSHSLPVAASQHIWSKLIVSMLFELGTIFSIFIAANLATLGEVNTELYKAFGYLVKKYLELTTFNGVIYALEVVVYVLVWMAASLLIMYFCLSVGQLVNRKKLLLSFGVLFGLYMLEQILATILIILGPILVEIPVMKSFLQDIFDWSASHATATFHIAAVILILVQAVLGFVYFLITERIMTKKLNLS